MLTHYAARSYPAFDVDTWRYAGDDILNSDQFSLFPIRSPHTIAKVLPQSNLVGIKYYAHICVLARAHERVFPRG